MHRILHTERAVWGAGLWKASLSFVRCTNPPWSWSEVGDARLLCPEDSVKWSLTCIPAFCLRPPTGRLFAKVTRLLWSASSVMSCRSFALIDPCCIMGHRGSSFPCCVSSPNATFKQDLLCISMGLNARFSLLYFNISVGPPTVG